MGYENDPVAALHGSLTLDPTIASATLSAGAGSTTGAAGTTSSVVVPGGIPKTRPQRPCDACRKRKSRCEIPENDARCVLCQFHKQPCTFVNDPPKKKRRASDGPHGSSVGGGGGGATIVVSQPVEGGVAAGQAGAVGTTKRAGAAGIGPGKTQGQDPGQVGDGRESSVGNGTVAADGSIGATDSPDIRKEPAVHDYADLAGPSLLKRTLGLQNHRHSSLLGPTSVYESRLLSLDAFRTGDDIPVSAAAGSGGRADVVALRKVAPFETFLLTPDVGTRNHGHEVEDLDAIESIVAPHGPELVNLYFRIVHPTFPILHKRVFLEKYARTHREFSPPLLAAVYILALNWWSYSAELSLLPKPDVSRLEEIAFKTMGDIVHRPKLSTIQAGLLLLQRPEGDSWAMVSQLVGLGQDLGLHLDCTTWRIPTWEKGLRKRLAWALYMQDKWGSLVHGRPSHITDADWDVKPLEESDFPERAADEDDEEGSTEVEKGRVLFTEMIALARILSDILLGFYTVAAEKELRERLAQPGMGVSWVLQRAKPLQLRLKRWFADLPDCLRLQDVTMRKLSSTGYLHLAYYAAEITLHRRIVRCLETETNPELVRVCRTAARERLVNALDFVNTLRPEHLQSFWYSASKYNFALVGTFISLLWATSPPSGEDASFYSKKLDEYRWSLRLSSKNTEIFERAITLLATSTGVLVKALPATATTTTNNTTTTSISTAVATNLHKAGHDEEDDEDLVSHQSTGTAAGSGGVLVSPTFHDDAGMVDPYHHLAHAHPHHQMPWFTDATGGFDPASAAAGSAAMFSDVGAHPADGQGYMSYRDM